MMMNRLKLHFIILTSALLSFTTHADDDCKEQLMAQGSPQQIEGVAPSCVAKLRPETSLNRVRMGANQYLMTALGPGLSIYQTEQNKIAHHFLAGDQTLLTEVLGLRPKGAQNERLIVLNQNDQQTIHVYESLDPGNIAPYRVLASEAIQDFIDVDGDLKQGEVYGLKVNELLVFSLDHHSRAAQESQRQAQPLRSVYFSQGQALSMALAGDQLIAVLFANGEIHFLDRQQLGLQASLEINDLDLSTVTLQWDDKNERLLLLHSGTIVEQIAF
jgi:hypothetical protein